MKRPSSAGTYIAAIFTAFIIISLMYFSSKTKTDLVNLQEEYEALQSQSQALVEELESQKTVLGTENINLRTDYDAVLERLNTQGFPLTSEEFELLAKVVYLEANVEPYEGQVAVARVVLNRVLEKSKWNCNSIEEVIYQKGQFNQITDRIDSTVPTLNNYKAVIDATYNTIDMPLNVDSFEMQDSGTQNTSAYERWKTIGNHNFNILK